jgi:hypothetical protein
MSPGFSERLAARLANEPLPSRRKAEAMGEPEVKVAVAAASRS